MTSGDAAEVAAGATAAGNAAEKVLRVLAALDEHPRLADLTRAVALPKSTVHRILQTLVSEGFASYDDATGSYAPGPRLLGLAGRVLGRVEVAAGTDPALRDLQERTGATVHLAVLADDEAVYVRKVESRKPYRMVSRVGMAVPLHSTSIGKALLAGMTDADVTGIVDRTGLPRRTPATITSVPVLLADLAGVRDRGWAVDREENESGIVCVGAGVRDHAGQVVAAVSVSQLKSDPDAGADDEVGPLVAATAAAITAAYGGR